MTMQEIIGDPAWSLESNDAGTFLIKTWENETGKIDPRDYKSNRRHRTALFLVQAVLPICNQEGILIEKDQERQP